MLDLWVRRNCRISLHVIHFLQDTVLACYVAPPVRLITSYSADPEGSETMTIAASARSTAASFRFAGRAAITSGVIGLVAYGFLWAFLVRMISGGDEQTCRPL